MAKEWTSVRLDPQIKAALKAEARLTGRSLSEVISMRLRGVQAPSEPKIDVMSTPKRCSHARAKVLHLKTCPDCQKKM